MATRIRGLRVGKKEPEVMTPERREELLRQARLKSRKQGIKVESWAPWTPAEPSKSNGG